MGYAKALSVARADLSDKWGKHRSQFKELMNRDRALFDDLKGFCSELAGALKAASRDEVSLHHSSVMTSVHSEELVFRVTFELRETISTGQTFTIAIGPVDAKIDGRQFSREDVEGMCSYIGKEVCDRFDPTAFPS